MNRRVVVFAVSVVVVGLLLSIGLGARSVWAQNKAVPQKAAQPAAAKPAAAKPAAAAATQATTPAAAAVAPKPAVATRAAASPLDDLTPIGRVSLAAYKGIMFNGLLGVPVYAGREDIPDAAPAPIAPKDERVALSLAGLLTQIQGNLATYKGTTTDQQELAFLNGTDGKPNITKLVGEALAAVNASPEMTQFRVRKLFFIAAFSSLAGADTVAPKLDALDSASFFLPWRKVVEAENGAALMTLLRNPRFLQRLGRCTYDDLLTRSASDPLVDDELLDLIGEARLAKLFGNLYSGATKANELCCDRVARVCVTGPGCNCWTYLGTGKCTLASQLCP